jgi:tetraacyldisaccharide 4'-kinase
MTASSIAGCFETVDLVTVDPVEWSGEDKLLPRGRWREPKSAIERAHAACIQSKPGVAIPHLALPSFEVNTAIDGIFNENHRVELETLRGQPVVAFAGIAKPDRFFGALENLGIIISRRMEFRDHHEYTARDVSDIASEPECEVRITTEKDSVRLEDTSLCNFLHLRISANIPEFDRLMGLIRSRFS